MGRAIQPSHCGRTVALSLSLPIYNTDVTVTETVKRMKNGTRETYPCPSSIALYSRFMGSIDCNEQIEDTTTLL